MPRRSPDGNVPSWSRLCRMAAPQQGYFTGAQAQSAGFSPQLLQYYIQKTLVGRVCRGVFHMSQYPHAQHEELMALWLWSKQEGVFSHRTALMLHELGEGVPDLLTLTMPVLWRRRRLRMPLASTVYYADVPADEQSRLGPFVLTSPLRTLVDCTLAGSPQELVELATRNAIRRRLFTRARLDRALRSAQPGAAGARKPPRPAPPPLRTRTYL